MKSSPHTCPINKGFWVGNKIVNGTAVIKYIKILLGFFLKIKPVNLKGISNNKQLLFSGINE